MKISDETFAKLATQEDVLAKFKNEDYNGYVGNATKELLEECYNDIVEPKDAICGNCSMGWLFRLSAWYFERKAVKEKIAQVLAQKQERERLAKQKSNSNTKNKKR